MIDSPYKHHSDKRFAAVTRTEPLEISGRVTGVAGLTVHVDAFAAPVGAQCEIRTRTGRTIAAEVVGFRGRTTVLIPLSLETGIAGGDAVRCVASQPSVAVGPHLLGRVLNGAGEPIDGKGTLMCSYRQAVESRRVSPMERSRIDAPIATGIRTIDTLHTCGQGQRMGIFSGPGVGKSVLLGTIARHTAADVTVIALVGERGREVREFIEKDLGPEGLERSIVVASTSEEPPPVRIRAAYVAATLAEYFRDQGKNVLLLMDSITRVAMAQRQIGLALGEPPATRGYTPSVFALLPTLVERCGKNQCGSITGFYTVLVEGDDLAEPISDAMRGLLDGHIWLSRNLANRGHYPAIDVTESISRVMVDIVPDENLRQARDLTRLVALYREIEDLVNIGAYAMGSNPEYDLAVQAQPAINQFLQQGLKEGFTFEQSYRQMQELFEAIRQQLATLHSGASGKSENKTEKSPSTVRRPLGLERMMAGIG